jgi:hypothetical protein
MPCPPQSRPPFSRRQARTPIKLHPGYDPNPGYVLPASFIPLSSAA